MKHKQRLKKTHEVFTPPAVVKKLIENAGPNAIDVNKTALDPCCGNGQILITLAKIRNSVENLYGVDIMVDNVCDTICRLHLFSINKLDPDPFNELGTTIEIVEPGFDRTKIDPTVDWIKTQNEFTRIYKHNGETVTVKFEGFDKSTPTAFFSCNGELVRNIVCADFLDFDSNVFDKDNIEFRNHVGCDLFD